MPVWLPPLLAAPWVGSFLGVLIRRLPAGRPVILARSACERCGATLAPRELVPLLSFAVLRGRCRRCGAAIGWFHPVVELAATAVAISAVLVEAEAAWIWAACGLGWTLLTLAWIDARHRRLPDQLTLPLTLAGLGVTELLDREALADHAAAAALGFAAFRGIALAYRALRGRDGLGGGDAKLLGAAGAWLGLAALPSVIGISALLGLGWAAILAGRGRPLRADTALAFGPWLAAAIWVVMLQTAAGAPSG